jgi:hypothetical protein
MIATVVFRQVLLLYCLPCNVGAARLDADSRAAAASKLFIVPAMLLLFEMNEIRR